MKVTSNTVVTLKHFVTDVDGQIVDKGDSALVYLHGGYEGIFAKLEAALAGLGVGDSVKVKLLPEDAFGEYDSELVQIEPRETFGANLKVNDQVEGREADADDTPENTRAYTVTNITEDSVVLDGNHPLAGMTLVFHATVAHIRAAREDELAQGWSSDESR